MKGSSNDVPAEQKDDETEYVISEDDDNEDEGNTGQVWMHILYKPQQLIHWYIVNTLIYSSTVDTYVFMYFFNIQVEISILCKDDIS